jgi:hypothetical protein
MRNLLDKASAAQSLDDHRLMGSLHIPAAVLPRSASHAQEIGCNGKSQGRAYVFDNTLYHQPEGPGLEAVAEGFRHLGFKDDHAQNAAEWIVYDAFYAYCQEMIKRGKPHGDFMS